MGFTGQTKDHKLLRTPELIQMMKVTTKDDESFSDHSRIASSKMGEDWLAGYSKGSSSSSTCIFGTNQRHAVSRSSHSA